MKMLEIWWIEQQSMNKNEAVEAEVKLDLLMNVDNAYNSFLS